MVLSSWTHLWAELICGLNCRTRDGQSSDYFIEDRRNIPCCYSQGLFFLLHMIFPSWEGKRTGRTEDRSAIFILLTCTCTTSIRMRFITFPRKSDELLNHLTTECHWYCAVLQNKRPTSVSTVGVNFIKTDYNLIDRTFTLSVLESTWFVPSIDSWPSFWLRWRYWL